MKSPKASRGSRKSKKKVTGFTPLEIFKRKNLVNFFALREIEKSSFPAGNQTQYQKLNQPRFLTGFTVIEIIIATGLLTIIAGLGLFLGIDQYKRFSLFGERDTLVSVMHTTRNRSMNNFNHLAQGLFIEPNRYTAFQGSSYTSRNPSYDEVFLISPGITASGLNEIVFSQLDGKANASGTVALTDNNQVLSISVNYEGRINW